MWMQVMNVQRFIELLTDKGSMPRAQVMQKVNYVVAFLYTSPVLCRNDKGETTANKI